MFCPPVGSRVRSQNLCRNTQRGSICTVSFNGNTWERQEVQDDCRKTVLIPFMKPDSESLLNTENRTRVRGGGCETRVHRVRTSNYKFLRDIEGWFN